MTQTAQQLEYFPEYVIRVGKPEDHSIVYGTILRGLTADPKHVYKDEASRLRAKPGSPTSAHVDRSLFMSEYHALIESALKRSTLVIAETTKDADPPELIIGFALVEGLQAWLHKQTQRPVIHYVHVKSSCRRRGIATRMLDANASGAFRLPIDPNCCEASHMRFETWPWIHFKWPKLRYNPFRMWPRETPWDKKQ